MTDNKNDLKKLLASDREVSSILRSGKLSRRDFMAWSGALGMSTALGSSLWSNRALANTPQRGGHLRAGLNDANTVDSLDSTQYNATTMIVISRAFRDSLVEVGQDNTAQPGLAESWEISEDGLTRVKHKTVDAAYFDTQADLSQYRQVVIGEIDVEFRKNWQRDQNRSRRDIQQQITDADMDQTFNSGSLVGPEQMTLRDILRVAQTPQSVTNPTVEGDPMPVSA